MKKLLSKLFLKIMGWKLVGEVPEEVKKAVMVCAPHTSNWDFPFALASFTITGLKVNYFIKKSWFFFPMNFLFKATGGVPVDRSKNHGMVDSMTMLLKESNEMIVVVPAEGTRSWVPKWKSGFYHIAKNANVPLLMESDALIRFTIGLVSLDAKVIAIEVDKNNKRVTTII